MDNCIIEEYLGVLQSWQHATREQRTAFLDSMEDKQYGFFETQNAWAWFLDGYVRGQRFATQTIAEAIGSK